MPDHTSSPRQPSLVVPTGACDCHAHIFGPYDKYPLAAGAGYRPGPAGKGEYLATLGRLGIQRMVIVQPSVYGFDNGATADAVVSFGLHRARGVAMVEPDVSDARLRELTAAGMRGARFITMSRGGPSLDDLETIAARIAPFGWHIQMYVDGTMLPDLEPVIRRLPVAVVLDHMGQVMADRTPADPGYQAVLRLLGSGQCWIKLSGYRISVAGYPYADVAPWARKLIAEAPQRCVWGTDWPHPNMDHHIPDDGELLDLLAGWAPDSGTLRRILVDNPAALYGFDEVAQPDGEP
jgi:predicted TIM-barrel fold metal-dependent hydrolase